MLPEGKRPKKARLGVPVLDGVSSYVAFSGYVAFSDAVTAFDNFNKSLNPWHGDEKHCCARQGAIGAKKLR